MTDVHKEIAAKLAQRQEFQEKLDKKDRIIHNLETQLDQLKFSKIERQEKAYRDLLFEKKTNGVAIAQLAEAKAAAKDAERRSRKQFEDLKDTQERIRAMEKLGDEILGKLRKAEREVSELRFLLQKYEGE